MKSTQTEPEEWGADDGAFLDSKGRQSAEIVENESETLTKTVQISDKFYGKKKETVSVASNPTLRHPFKLCQPSLFLQQQLNHSLVDQYVFRLSGKLYENIYG